MDFDLKIVGGTIVDCSGSEDYRGDVGILDGRVATLGKIKGYAARALDAGAHASQLCDARYSTYLLGHWSRNEGAMPLEKAVHMLTKKPATLMGIADRGLLAQELPADIVVFYPQRVGATGLIRVHDQPVGQDGLVSQAKGIHAVAVNGMVIREDNTDRVAPDSDLPGRVLRSLQAA